VVLASQRSRLLRAMADVVGEKGYAAATVADAIARAGVSRKTFYEQFRDKQDCFLAAYDADVERVLELVRSSGADAPDVLTRSRASVRAYLGALASEPALARTFMLEVLAAGPAARARRDAVHDRFAVLLREQVAAARRDLPDLAAPPDAAYLAAVGATDALVSRFVAEGRTAELPQLENAVLYVQLTLLGSGGAPVGEGGPAGGQ